MKTIVFFLTLFFSLSAQATTYYGCDCQSSSGSMTGCVAGADGNAGTSSASPKQTRSAMQTLIGAGVDGDSFLFCKGGAWNVDTPLIIRNTNISTTGITIGSYQSPNWTTYNDSGTWTSVGSNTLTDSTKSWTTNQYAGHGLRAFDQFGASLYIIITSNTGTTLTLSENWRLIPQSVQPNKTYTIEPPRPRFVSTSTADNGGNIQFTGSDVSNGPYILQDITSQGPNTSTPSQGNMGIFMNRGVHDLLVQNVDIRGSGNTGFFFGDANDPNETPGRLKNITLRNSQVYDNYHQGALGGVLYQKVIGNSFDNNGWGASGNGDHHIYLSNEKQASGPSANAYGYGYQIVGNTLTKNSNVGGTCQSVVIVIHGYLRGALIQGNSIIETSSTYAGGCYGIIVDSGYTSVEEFNGVTIRGNLIVNSPLPIGGNALPYALIENNNIVFNVSGGDFYGITLPVQNSSILTTGDATDTASTIRNNSFYISQGNVNAALINFGEFNLNPGTNVSVVNNLGFIGSAVNATHSCNVLGTRAFSDFTNFNWNLCYHQAGNGRWGRSTDTNSYATLANAQAAGFDTNGLSSDPLYSAVPSASNSWSCALSSSSPAKNAGSTTFGAPNAFGGIKPIGTRDIGACEQ